MSTTVYYQHSVYIKIKSVPSPPFTDSLCFQDWTWVICSGVVRETRPCRWKLLIVWVVKDYNDYKWKAVLRVQRRVAGNSREETGMSAWPIITETRARFSRVPLSFDMCDGVLWPLCLFIHHIHITRGIVVPERMNKQCGPQLLPTLESIVLFKNMIPLVITSYPCLLKFHTKDTKGAKLKHLFGLESMCKISYCHEKTPLLQHNLPRWEKCTQQESRNIKKNS